MKDIRTITENILLEIGANPSLRGFEYTVDAIQELQQRPCLKYHTMALYDIVAEKHNCKRENVERAIRTTKEIVLTRGNLENIYKYFPTMNEKFNNANFLCTLNLHIGREMEGEGNAN